MPFNGRFIADLIFFAGQAGADPAELLALTGCTADELSVERKRVENEVYAAVIERAIARTGDPLLGLHAGEYMNISSAGIVLQLMQSAQTLREALQLACDFANLGCSSLPLTLRETSSAARLELIPDPVWLAAHPLAVRQTADGVIGFTLREIHLLTRRERLPVRVEYQWGPPENPAEMERVYGTPIQYHSPTTAIILPPQILDLPVSTRDAGLLQVLMLHAQQKLAEFEQQTGFATVVRRAIICLANPELPDQNQVAANLNLSVRTLQRRLKEENATFRGLIEEAREQFARKYLKNPALQVNEIAWMLGYTEPSTFTRSFRRWTGAAPAAWRAGL